MGTCQESQHKIGYRPLQHDDNNKNRTPYIEYIIPDALPSAGSVVVPYRINCHSDNVKTKNNQDNNINESNIFIFFRFDY